MSSTRGLYQTMHQLLLTHSNTRYTAGVTDAVVPYCWLSAAVCCMAPNIVLDRAMGGMFAQTCKHGDAQPGHMISVLAGRQCDAYSWLILNSQLMCLTTCTA